MSPRKKSSRRHRAPTVKSAKKPLTPARKAHGTVTGRFTLTRRGFGFVANSDDSRGDLLITRSHIAGAMDGDQVRARITSIKADGRLEGTISEVLERAHKTIIGVIESKHKRQVIIRPLSDKNPYVVAAQLTTIGDAPMMIGQVVSTRIETYPSNHKPILVKVERIIGEEGDPQVDLFVVAETYGILTEHDPLSLQEAEALPSSVSLDDLDGRTDLRQLVTFTIDGADARDFDDAVSLTEQDGRRVLYVHIADVSHYVAPGSALDQEAYLRGNSVYFPDQVFPMFTHLLSNGILSLNPFQDRLTMTVEMHVNSAGKITKSTAYKSVICSNARLTYAQVHNMLEQGIVYNEFEELVPTLTEMLDLAKSFSRRRIENGSIDLDLPESKVLMDKEGRITDVIEQERNWANRLIEEFMLAANVCVASFLVSKGRKQLFRVHEQPDPGDIKNFAALIKTFDIDARGLEEGQADPKFMQKILNDTKDEPYHKLISTLLLRSFKQARYTPENHGHFGLNFENYCHFTSPIRRYPDLITHRILKQVISGSPLADDVITQLTLTGTHCSETERSAMEAERRYEKLKKIEYLEDKVGECFEGYISGVQEFGLFVEILPIAVDGLIPFHTLNDDNYAFHPAEHSLIGKNTGLRLMLGMRVDVRLDRVRREDCKIDLRLVKSYPIR